MSDLYTDIARYPVADDIVQPLRLNKIPLSLQAQQYLLDLIQSGAYQPGEQLPSEADLAAQLGISRPTLREALLNLEIEGVVVRRHGAGTFVAPGFRRRLESGLERLQSILEVAAGQGLQIRFTALEVQEEEADPEVAEKLHVPPGTSLTSVRRVFVVDGRPVAYMHDVALPEVLSPDDVDESFDGSVLDLLRHKRQGLVAHAVADIIALGADDFLSEKLRVKPRQALLLIEELLFDQEGKAIEFSRNYFLPDDFRFHVIRH